MLQIFDSLQKKKTKAYQTASSFNLWNWIHAAIFFLLWISMTPNMITYISQIPHQILYWPSPAPNIGPILHQIFAQSCKKYWHSPVPDIGQNPAPDIGPMLHQILSKFHTRYWPNPAPNICPFLHQIFAQSCTNNCPICTMHWPDSGIISTPQHIPH